MSDRATAEAAAHAANSETSFYVLLTLPETYHPTAETPIPATIPSALLRKSYRQTSLRYHPDKNPSPDAAATFHTLTTAYSILGDAATKAAYDQALVARLVRNRKSQTMDARRRTMKEDLEAREHAAAAAGAGVGVKRQRVDEEGEMEKKLERLREEGAKLKMKRKEALRKAEMDEENELEEKQRRSRETETTSTSSHRSTANHPSSISPTTGEPRFSDMDKTVFIKFHTEPPTHSDDQLHPILINESTLRNFFSKFGEIATCLVREPPPASTASNDSEEKKGLKRKKKKNNSTTTAVLVFRSILAAYDAVNWFRTGGGGDSPLWKRVKDAKFAKGEDPDLSGILPQRNGGDGHGGGGHGGGAGSGGHVSPTRNAKASSAHTYASWQGGYREASGDVEYI